MDNDTTVFFLLEFSNIWELQLLYAMVLLFLYLIALAGNLLIISAVVLDSCLHIPMYFFLTNLAIQDIGSISVIVPKAVFNSVMNINSISYPECIIQVFLFVFFVDSDISLLTVMAFDRYVAICNPLQYEMIMNREVCTKIIISVWIVSFLNAVLNTVGTFITPFCSNMVNQFYCEIPPLLKLACSDLYVIETGIVGFVFTITFGCFAFIIVTYIQVFAAVSKIPSDQGRKKAFSTCFPHLIVFSLFLFTASLAYLRPQSEKQSNFDIIVTIMYCIIPPMLNPVIYSMRNKDIKVSLSRILVKSNLRCNSKYCI